MGEITRIEEGLKDIKKEIHNQNDGKWHLDRKLNIGNLIAIILFFGTAVSIYIEKSEAIASNQKDIQTIEKSIEELKIEGKEDSKASRNAERRIEDQLRKLERALIRLEALQNGEKN